MSNPSYNNNDQRQHTHHLTRFFLVVSLFIIAVSILAVYSTISASEYGLKKDQKIGIKCECIIEVKETAAGAN
jgi:hypothetical protein